MATERASDEPQVGDMIRLRTPPKNARNVARVIIGIDGDRIETAGMSGRQRNRTMSRSALAAYERVSRAPRERHADD